VLQCVAVRLLVAVEKMRKGKIEREKESARAREKIREHCNKELHCNTLQHSVAFASFALSLFPELLAVFKMGRVSIQTFRSRWMELICIVAVCCSVLQYVAVYCRVLRCVAVCCSVLQYVAVCCSMLQYVAA